MSKINRYWIRELHTTDYLKSIKMRLFFFITNTKMSNMVFLNLIGRKFT